MEYQDSFVSHFFQPAFNNQDLMAHVKAFVASADVSWF